MKYILLISCITIIKTSSGQVVLLDSLLEERKYDIVLPLFQKFLNLDNDSSTYWHYQGKVHLQKREMRKALNAFNKVDTLKLPENYKGWFFFALGDSYRYSNQEEKAFSLKLRAQKLFNKSGNNLMANRVNYDLHYTLISQDFLDYDGESYLQTFFENAERRKIPDQLLTAHLALSFLDISSSKAEDAAFHLDKATRYALTLGTPKALFKLHNYKAVFHQSFTTEYDKALHHVDSMHYYAKILGSPNKMESSFKTRAYTFTLLGRYQDAITELLKADSLPISENIYNRKKHLYQYLALNYENLGQLNSAYKYLKKMLQYKDSININSQNTILTLLGTAELEKNNLQLEARKQWHRNVSLASTVGFILVSIIAIAVSKYWHKKKLLVEKEKELQEINARNEESDKQRQRIAAELHDNLGSSLIAIQLCFQNIKARKDRFLAEEERLMLKAKDLLDQVYQKIRNIAHIEDAASRHSEGLVASITNFAVRVGESKNLIVEVQSHGVDDNMDKRLENDLSRIVIELITNIIKHAKATEVSVDIACADRSLNVIVEDDGVGFNVSTVSENKGLGLYRSKKKIEEYGGNLTIESIEGKGTTVIINIPV